MYVMMISAHSPESCSMFNKESEKTGRAAMQQIPSLVAKHGIKVVAMWADLAAHTTHGVSGTPSIDAAVEALSRPIWGLHPSKVAPPRIGLPPRLASQSRSQ
jgi:hypothetical protein